MSIGHIDDRYTGPFEDEIRELKQYSDFNKKYPPEIAMEYFQVLYAFGYPDDINSTITANAKSQQLVYKKLGMYIYLENGKVTTIQN